MHGGRYGGGGAHVREIVFGLEESLILTSSVAIGLAVSGISSRLILVVGTILVCVEAFRMSAFGLLTSRSARELYTERFAQDSARVLSERIDDDETLRDLLLRKALSDDEIDVVLVAVTRERRMWLEEVHRNEYRLSPGVSPSEERPAFVLAVSAAAGGVLALLPFVLLASDRASAASLLLVGVALFLLGLSKSRMTGLPSARSGFEAVVVGVAACAIGYLLGFLVTPLFP